jgi:hypothetical protein
MMKKNKLIYLFVGLIFAFTSCDEPGSDTIWSLSHLQLDAATTTTGARVYSYLRENNGQNVPSGFQVLLASAPLDEAVNITFEVVAGSSANTAIENVHYVVNSNSVTIPAGENIAELPIDIIDEGINPGELWDIEIRLVSADIEIGESFGQAVHSVQITCPSDLEGSYNYVSTATNGSPGFWNGSGVVTLTSISATTYELSDYANGAFGSPAPMSIEDICEAISEGAPDTSTGAIQSGSVDPSTGVITINFELTCCGGNNGDTWTYVMTPQ